MAIKLVIITQKEQYDKLANLLDNNKDKYKLYLKTKHWKSKKQEAYEFFGHKCYYCEQELNNRYNVHHLNYDNLWNEVAGKDIVLTCKSCHSKQHGIKPFSYIDKDVDEIFRQINIEKKNKKAKKKIRKYFRKRFR